MLQVKEIRIKFRLKWELKLKKFLKLENRFGIFSHIIENFAMLFRNILCT